jgi:predicted RNA polymerase sigma factor
LITVASRRLTDLLRSEQARQRRENILAQWTLPVERVAQAVDRQAPDADDTLILLLMCCHPALSAASQIALTLRAVGGLSTLEIAHAFLVSEASITRRITRAKQSIKDTGLQFRMPAASEFEDRLHVVLHVLYLIFNEGYSATSGANLYRTDLSSEAIRLCRVVHHLLPEDAEVSGLLALMLLTDARRPARAGPMGELVPMPEQHRSRWNTAHINEGVALVTAALRRGKPGLYQVQAAIAALHDEASSFETTDWEQIVALYEVLLQSASNPVVKLNHAVAVGVAYGPRAGLGLIEKLEAEGTLAADYRLYAVRAHLEEMSGDLAQACESYSAAAELAPNLARQRYLNAQAARLKG